MPQIWDETHKTDQRVIHIEPVTRLEGHAKIDIFLEEDGSVDRAYFQVPELRGFEKFCEGRFFREMPGITARICGICPVAYQLSAAQALEQADAPQRWGAPLAGTCVSRS